MKCKIKITPRILKYLTTKTSIANNVKKRTNDEIKIGNTITVNFNNVLYGQFKNMFGEENITKETIKEQELRSIIKEEIKRQLNENIKIDLVPEIEKIAKKYFPNSYFTINSGPLSGDDYWFAKFAIGQKKDWSNGYIENSPINFGFSIEDKDNDKYSFSPKYSGIYVKPAEDSYYVYDTIKIPTKKKTGNSKSVLISIEKLFSDTKRLVKDNFDRFKPESQKWIKKYI